MLIAAKKLIPAKIMYSIQLILFNAVGMYSANQKFTNLIYLNQHIPIKILGVERTPEKYQFVAVVCYSLVHA